MQPLKKPGAHQRVIGPALVQAKPARPIANAQARLQAPPAVQLKRPPVAPPVYRPQQTAKPVQAKMVNGALQTRTLAVAPPVYRPNSGRQTLQPFKAAPDTSARAAAAVRRNTAQVPVTISGRAGDGRIGPQRVGSVNLGQTLTRGMQRKTGGASAPPVYRGGALPPLFANISLPNARAGKGTPQQQQEGTTTALVQPMVPTKQAKSHCGCTKCSCSARKTRRKPVRVVQRQIIQRQVIQRMDDSDYSSEGTQSSEDFTEIGCAEDNCITADCDVKDTYHQNGVARPLGQTIRSRFYGGFTAAVDPIWKNARLLAVQGACGVGNFACEHCGNCYANNTASIDHIVPVVAHWNAIGHNTDQVTRQAWYNNTANLRVVYGPHNSSLGGGGQVYQRDVTTNFSGNANC